jgi:hypothetical protein
MCILTHSLARMHTLESSGYPLVTVIAVTVYSDQIRFSLYKGIQEYICVTTMICLAMPPPGLPFVLTGQSLKLGSLTPELEGHGSHTV